MGFLNKVRILLVQRMINKGHTNRDSGPVSRDALSELGVGGANEGDLNLMISLFHWNRTSSSRIGNKETEDCRGLHFWTKDNWKIQDC